MSAPSAHRIGWTGLSPPAYLVLVGLFYVFFGLGLSLYFASQGAGVVYGTGTALWVLLGAWRREGATF